MGSQWTEAQLSAHSGTAKTIWDYYKSKGTTLSANSSAIKSKGSTNITWWTRSADHIDNELFFAVNEQGNCASDRITSEYGASPAFRIG